MVGSRNTRFARNRLKERERKREGERERDGQRKRERERERNSIVIPTSVSMVMMPMAGQLKPSWRPKPHPTSPITDPKLPMTGPQMHRWKPKIDP